MKQPSPRIRRVLLALGGAATVGAVIAATIAVGGTTAGSDSMIGTATDAPPTASAAPNTKQIYSNGTYSVQLAVYNDTNQTMTYTNDPSIDVVGSGHWATRPVSLAPGQSMIATAYTTQPSGFSWTVMWKLDNGEYATVFLKSAELGNESPHDISVGVGSGWESGGWVTPDPNFAADLTNSSGSHSWVTVHFKPASN